MVINQDATRHETATPYGHIYSAYRVLSSLVKVQTILDRQI